MSYTLIVTDCTPEEHEVAKKMLEQKKCAACQKDLNGMVSGSLEKPLCIECSLK
jgi:hypothetical protein